MLRSTGLLIQMVAGSVKAMETNELSAVGIRFEPEI